MDPLTLMCMIFLATFGTVHCQNIKLNLIDKGNYMLIPSNLDPSANDVVKIMCISDTHNIWTKQINICDLPDVDILIHSGDITMLGGLNELKEWSLWLNKYLNIHFKAKYAVIISGNHDLTLHETYYNSMGHTRHFQNKQNVTKCKQQIMFVDNSIYLCDESVNIQNINFYGSPWTPYIGNWAFGKQRGDELNDHWNNVLNNKEIDILITHGPPFNHGDLIPQKGNILVGDVDLMNKIKEIKPKYNVFGHIHEGYGVTIDKDNKLETKFINAAMLDEHYKVINKPIVFYFKSSTIDTEKSCENS